MASTRLLQLPLDTGQLLVLVSILFTRMQAAEGITCFCLGHCPNNALNGTCQAPPGAPCFSAVEEVLDPETNLLVPERTYGCLPADEKGLMQCKGHLVPHFEPRSIACCADYDMCNKDLSPMYEPTVEPTVDPLDPSVYHVALLVSLTICLVIFILLVTLAYLRYKQREDRRQRYMAEAAGGRKEEFGGPGTST